MARLIRKTITAWLAWRSRRALARNEEWRKAQAKVAAAKAKHGRVNDARRELREAVNAMLQGSK